MRSRAAVVAEAHGAPDPPDVRGRDRGHRARRADRLHADPPGGSPDPLARGPRCLDPGANASRRRPDQQRVRRLGASAPAGAPWAPPSRRRDAVADGVSGEHRGGRVPRRRDRDDRRRARARRPLRDGGTAVNPLTWMALRVARDVGLIDPKVNLRITGETDLALLELASDLTRKGLGFPQYANDDVVIPALAAHGYALEDARDYTVAACWEFIIPGRGMDVVNIGAVSFPAAADAAVRTGLADGASFDAILARTGAEIGRQVHERTAPYERLLWAPAPYYSVLMTGALEAGVDHGAGARYRNLGIHGAAAASAADALAAVRRHVFELADVDRAELLAALEADFVGHEALRWRLAEESPRVGLNEPAADDLVRSLYDRLADACEEEHPQSGAIVRPGTGSAMYYLWLARGRDAGPLAEPVVGATADGRRRGDPFGANLAPTPGTHLRGPISVLQSYAGIDYGRVCNGGPITLELSASVFADAESIRKVALLVRTFARLGCQQLQLNALNAEQLLDARAHPDEHRDLIVRVWGWSGYFCELAPEYQEHVISRHLYGDV